VRGGGNLIGAISGALAQQHLKGILLAISGAVMCAPEAYIQHRDDLIDASGAIADERARKFLQAFVDRLAAFVNAFAPR
jgi:chromate reductase